MSVDQHSNNRRVGDFYEDLLGKGLERMGHPPIDLCHSRLVNFLGCLGVGMDGKERMKLLADAASVVQVNRGTRFGSGWFFFLAACAALISVFRSGMEGIGWVAASVVLGLTGLYSVIGTNTETALGTQASTSVIVVAYSAYNAFHRGDGIGFVFAVALIRPLILAIGRMRTFRAAKGASAEYVTLVSSVFTSAKKDPATTPNLIALRRSSGVRSVLTNKEEDYEYRLVFERDLVFLIGWKSFFGLRFSARISLITPSRTFHIDEVGESWSGKRKRVNLILDTDAVSPTLEIVPDMLEKARRQAVLT